MSSTTQQKQMDQQEPENGPQALTWDEIARRAYARYVARGEKDGHDVEDWLQAERESIDGTNKETDLR
jgi:hypothetical protein